MELGAWNGGRIIENSDNRGSDNRGSTVLFLLFTPSAVRRPTWFPDILGNSSYPIFTKFGMQVYWVNSLYGIAFGDDSSIAN